MLSPARSRRKRSCVAWSISSSSMRPGACQGRARPHSFVQADRRRCGDVERFARRRAAGCAAPPRSAPATSPRRPALRCRTPTRTARAARASPSARSACELVAEQRHRRAPRAPRQAAPSTRSQPEMRAHAGAQHLGRPERRRALEREHLREPERRRAAQDACRRCRHPAAGRGRLGASRASIAAALGQRHDESRSAAAIRARSGRPSAPPATIATAAAGSASARRRGSLPAALADDRQRHGAPPRARTRCRGDRPRAGRWPSLRVGAPGRRASLRSRDQQRVVARGDRA